MYFNGSNTPAFGSLKVRVGEYLSGKSDRIIDNAEIAARQTVGPMRKFKRVLLVRPASGKFQQSYIVKAHSGDKFNVYEEQYKEENNVGICVLDYAKEDSLFISHNNYDLYLIDDGHHYSEKIVWAIQKLIHQGKDVYFVGRRFNARGNIYPTTLAVMLLPEVTDYKVLYNQRLPRLGKPELKLRFGPMFSTKTKKVIRKAKNTKVIASLVNGKITMSPAQILIVRPGQDSRFNDKYVFTTHANRKTDFKRKQWKNIDVKVLPYGQEEELLETEANLVIFDEGQFFSPPVATVVAQLIKNGKEIYFTGLLHDFQDKVFPTSEAMMRSKETTNIRKLWAQCSRCQGEMAFSSARVDKSDKIINEGAQVMIGDDKLNKEEIRYIAIHQQCRMRELGLI